MFMPMMPFFASEMTDATLITYGADTYDDAGELVQGSPSTMPIRIVVPQPLKANDLQMLDSGERISDCKKTYADSEIATRIGSSSANTVTVSGFNYKVVQVEDRPVGSFRKVIMRRFDG